MAVVVVPATTTTTTAATTTVAAAPVATTTTTTAAPAATTTTAAPVATVAPAGAPVNLSAPAPAEVDTPALLPAEAVGSIELQSNNQAGVDAGIFGTGPAGSMPRDNDAILASGLLTPEQVEASKLDNIYKLMNCNGCSAEQTQELALYLQRYVMDGYIRGADVPAMINTGNDEVIQFHIGDPNGWLSGVADTGGGPNVTLNGFDTASDGWKFSLFYHEVSHNILDRGHNLNDQSMMYGPNNVGNLRSPDQLSANYDYMVGELFNPDNWGQVATGGNAPVSTIPSGFIGSGSPLPAPPSTSFTPQSNNAPVYNTGSPYTPTYSPTYTTGSPYTPTGPTTRSPAPMRFDPIPTLSLDPFGEIDVPQQLSGGMGGAGPTPTTGYPTPGYSGTNGSTPRSPYGAPQGDASSVGAQIGPANEFEADLDQVIQQASPLLRDLGGALAGMKSS